MFSTCTKSLGKRYGGQPKILLIFQRNKIKLGKIRSVGYWEGDVR